MPIYEYKCEKCVKIHEVMQKFSDPKLTECPDCTGPIEKLMSLSAFSLKGTGWYVTDYKKKASPPSETKTEEASAGGTSQAGDSKTGDSKTGEPASAAPASSPQGTSGAATGAAKVATTSAPPAGASSNSAGAPPVKTSQGPSTAVTQK
jgi:putative FmdB family regulatory protein